MSHAQAKRLADAQTPISKREMAKKEAKLAALRSRHWDWKKGSTGLRMTLWFSREEYQYLRLHLLASGEVSLTRFVKGVLGVKRPKRHLALVR
jgi:hypothetical protein